MRPEIFQDLNRILATGRNNSTKLRIYINERFLDIFYIYGCIPAPAALDTPKDGGEYLNEEFLSVDGKKRQP